MANKIKSAIAKVLRIKPEVKIAVPIDDRLAEKDEQVKALMKDNASKSGQIASMKAEERKKEDKKQEEDEQQRKFDEIAERELEIKREKFIDALSLKDLFIFLNKNPKFKVSLMDRDMGTNLGVFDNLIIFRDGELGIVDNELNILSKGKELNHIFFKPGALKGQIDKKLIRLPCDRDFRGIPDLEEVEVPECSYDPISGKIKWGAFAKKPLKELVQDREESIAKVSEYSKRLEEENSKLNKNNQKYARELHLMRSRVNQSNVELSVMTGQYNSMQKKFRNLKNKLSNSQSMRTLLEQQKEKLHKVVESLNKFVSDKLSKADYETFLDSVKDMNDWIEKKKVIPQLNAPAPPKPKQE